MNFQLVKINEAWVRITDGDSAVGTLALKFNLSLSLSLPVFLCISFLFSLSLCHIFWLKKELINYHPYSTVPLLYGALRNNCVMFPSCPKLKVCLYAMVAPQASLLFQSNLNNLSTYTSSWLFRSSEQVEDAVDTRRSLQIYLIGDHGKFHTMWFKLACTMSQGGKEQGWSINWSCYCKGRGSSCWDECSFLFSNCVSVLGSKPQMLRCSLVWGCDLIWGNREKGN